MNKILASSLVLGLVSLAGCPDIKTDSGEGEVGPTVQFDPAASIIPFPNNLALDPTTGRVNLPKQCNEGIAQTVIRTTLLNTLDGFGTYESALQVTFSEALDPQTLDGNVLLYQRATGMTANDPATITPIAVTLIPGMTVQSSADCMTSTMVTSLTIIAQGALEQRSTYTVALTKGIKTASGAEFGASFFWSLVSQASSPVTFDDQGNVTENHTPLDPNDEAQLAQLGGISLLWGAHKPALDFLAGAGHARGDLLVAWEFNTQSNDALDPTAAGSPAAVAYGSTVPLQGIASQVPTGATPTEVLLSKGIPCDTGAGGLPCGAVGDILGGALTSKSYQQDLANPMGGMPLVPGPWNDPVRPTVVHPDNLIEVLAAIPAGTAPAGGWPTVVFGHGLGSSKTTMFAIAPQLAQAGFATVAIDFVAHDSRAVRTSSDMAKGCADVDSAPPAPPDPTRAPQCFAPFLSSDLAGTRDNIRQTVLDLEGLVAALKACGPGACGALAVDATHLAYMGISLGGIIGSTTVANVPDFQGAVLNVPAVGLIDVLENTPSLAIRCSLVDALISVGVVMGTPSDPPVYSTGTCMTDEWKTQPGYQQFSVIGRWVLDPADGANFTRKLAARKILIQEVVNDEVVPNIATDHEAELVGLAAMPADRADGSVIPPPASAAITMSPTSNKFVKYVNLDPSAVPPFPGNTFHHASLLLPATTVVPPFDAPCDLSTGEHCDGTLGTLQVQSDAITFLINNH